MAMRTDMTLAAFSERTGIHRASGDVNKALDALSLEAYNLIKVIELERSGIRDGDGYWHGCDVMDTTVNAIQKRFQAYRQQVVSEWSPTLTDEEAEDVPT